MRTLLMAAAFLGASPAAAAIAWGGPGWYVMAFDEGGWHAGLRGQYSALDGCRAQEARLRAGNTDPEIDFDCVYLPSAPIPVPYYSGVYVSLPAGANVDGAPLQLRH